MRAILIALLFALLPIAAKAGEGYQDRPSLCANIPLGPRSDRCHEWVQNLPRPDTATSCCGPADAYVADDFVRRDGKLFFIITEDYAPPTTFDGEGNPIPCTQCF